MSKIVSGIEKNDYGLNFTLITLAVGYVFLMCVRKITAATIGIMVVSLRSKLNIILSDYYMVNIFQKGKLSESENSGDITQRLNQATEELSTILRNIVQNFIPPLLQLCFSIIVIMLNGSYIVASLFFVYFTLYFVVKKHLITR